MKFLKKIFSIKKEDKGVKLYIIFNILGIKITKTVKNLYFEKLNKEKYERELTFDEKKYYLKQKFKYALGYDLDIDNPKTFNEKIQWLKLYDHNHLMTICADKYKAREYIKEKIGEEYLVPLLSVWDTPDEINFDKLPNQFVLKVNWGSGQNIIVKDKSKLNIKKTKEKLKNWLKPKSNHYFMGLEWCYKNIEPKIICEKYIEQLDGNLLDYKFFCFNGNPKCLFIASDRGHDTKFDFFDNEFNWLPIKNHYKNSTQKINKPYFFEKMKELATIIAQDFTFVRVDFFEINNQVYLGETTFYHFNGMESFEPKEWDYKLGEMLELKDIKDKITK